MWEGSGGRASSSRARRRTLAGGCCGSPQPVPLEGNGSRGLVNFALPKCPAPKLNHQRRLMLQSKKRKHSSSSGVWQAML